MSKDKGSKNQKKAPAENSSGKAKVVSSYKQESNSKDATLNTFTSKADQKHAGKGKS
jgi:hypothetical protein